VAETPRYIRELRAPKILDFDIENRPLSYRGYDKTTSEVTAIAAKFLDEPTMHCWLLPEHSTGEMLEGFVALYREADIVTGHYIRGHDLPLVNAALVQHGYDMLDPIQTVDTCMSLPKLKDTPKSQEYIATMLGVPQPKVGMSTADWDEANRLTKEGIALTRSRVTGDVYQHEEMFARLQERKLLTPPKTWTPYSAR
jgi:hypothetical protein